MTRRRPVVQYAPLTSLLDVMFILVFASLVHGAALEVKAKRADTPPAPAPAPAEHVAADAGAKVPLDPEIAAAREAEVLRRSALAQLVTGLEGRAPVVVRVGRDGQLRSLERLRDGRAATTALGLPLVERVPDPDVGLAYLGDRQDGLRLCSLLRLHLGAADLSDTLVIVAPEEPLDRMSVALARGLQRDAERCMTDQRGAAVIVDPQVVSPPRTEQEGAAP